MIRSMKKCPDCGKNKLKRLFGTGAAIVFKGSGFYQTDYRSEGYKKAAAAESKSQSSDKGECEVERCKSGRYEEEGGIQEVRRWDQEKEIGRRLIMPHVRSPQRLDSRPQRPVGDRLAGKALSCDPIG